MGIVYKLTCETGNVYYGSTKHNIEYRKDKGWYHCACKDFINPKIEVVEECENYLEREDYYINNYECINNNRAIGLTQKEYMKEYVKNGKKKVSDKKYQEKVYSEKKYYCELCDINCSSSYSKNKHNQGKRHKLKYESYLKYGDNWKEHYINDNRKRYAETKKNKIL